MATRPEHKLTYDDYVTFPEGERYELIDGEAYMVPSPNEKHQRILGELHLHVATFLKRHGGGRVYVAPFDVVLDPGDVLQPDIVFIADVDLAVLTAANVWGTPTWVVEILSSEESRDRKLKFQRYQRFGVPELWIVDPGRERVEVYRLQDDTYGEPMTFGATDRVGPLRPEGLEIEVAELFADDSGA
ncbi:MAG: Uma2 family endonuclease [Actinomycetota bacterium]